MKQANEKNFLASFNSYDSARTCQQALQQQGFDVVQVDDIPSGPAASAGELPHAAQVEWGRHGYQADTLDDKWTAASSWDQSATGLIEGGGWLLTAVVPAERAHEASTIIHKHGGKV